MEANLPKGHRPLTKEEEERKRDAALARNPKQRMQIILDTLQWAEAQLPPHLKRNRPRQPHQKFE